MSSENAYGLSRGAYLSLGVFALLFVLVLATREERVQVGIKKLDLVSLDPAKVERIAVTSKDTVTTLTKDGASWKVYDEKDPSKRYAADEALVTSALDALAELEADSFVTGRAEKHADLEIDDDKGLKVKVEAGAVPLDIVFGRVAKGGGNYLRLAGSDEVFVGKGRFAALVKKDVKGWRKRKLVDTEADKLSKITIEKPGEMPYTIEATKADGEDKKTWSLAAGAELPEGFRVDEAALGRIVTSFASLRAAEFVDDAVTDMGLGESGKLTATTEDGKAITVRFGKEDENKRAYAEVEGDEQRYLLSSYTVKNVVKSKLELRDLTLLPFEANQVERAVFTAGGEVVEVKKQDGSWALVQPSQTPAGYEFDAAGVEGKLAGLARTRGSRLAEAGAGLGEPSVTVDLFVEGGEQKQLVFGQKAPMGEGSGEEFFVRGEGDLLYRVGAWQKGRYEKALDLFKKVEPPPMPPGGGPSGLDSLPPDLRKQLEQAMKNQGMR